MRRRKETRSPQAADFITGALIGLSIVITVFVLVT